MQEIWHVISAMVLYSEDDENIKAEDVVYYGDIKKKIFNILTCKICFTCKNIEDFINNA